MVLRVKGLYFTVKGTHFQVDYILHAHPNTCDGVKYFLEVVYTKKKMEPKFHSNFPFGVPN